MKKKNRCRVILLSFVVMTFATSSAQQTISSSFNSSKVILPSSQYTPSQTYQAMVWVANNNEQYSDEFYNKVIATPPTDAQNRQWYDPDYEPTDGEYEWQMATSPFSSDETYKGHQSFRWVTGGIMADIYLRRTFVLTDIPAGTVFLACGHDDAPAEFYINGVLVHSISDGWNNNEYYLLSDEQKALIKTDGSENVIAVHVHQNWGGAFADCGLYEADMMLHNNYLPTMELGPWQCKYYFLNYNDDIAIAEAGEYFDPEADETEWIDGEGPFSSGDDAFFVTRWPSRVRPILIRRHFNLTQENITEITDNTVKFVCSYDENPRVYLNGTFIWQASGYNDNDYASYILRGARKNLLHEGDNVIAVSLQQGVGSGHIDLGIFSETEYTPTGIESPRTAVESNRAHGVYSLDGIRLGDDVETLKPGIYIVDGKKHVITK